MKSARTAPELRGTGRDAARITPGSRIVDDRAQPVQRTRSAAALPRTAAGDPSRSKRQAGESGRRVAGTDRRDTGAGRRTTVGDREPAARGQSRGTSAPAPTRRTPRRVPSRPAPAGPRQDAYSDTAPDGRTATPRDTRRGRPRSAAASQRGRRVRQHRPLKVNPKRRHRGALVILAVLMVAALVKLIFIQGVDAKELAGEAMAQGETTLSLPATRGSITDRNGTPLAFSIEGRAIAVRPALIVADEPLAAGDHPYVDAAGHPRPIMTAAQKREKIADIVVATLGTRVSRADLLADLNSTHRYVYLAHKVMPAQADAIMTQVAPLFDATHINAMAVEREDIRQNPDGTLAAAVVGTTGWGGVGLAGVESKFNAVLTGTPGSRTVQHDSANREIPNTATNTVPTVDGTSLTLTIDSDLQYTAQEMLDKQVASSQARGGCIVVKGISDGQIYAMACSQPGKTAAEIGNPAVTTPFEPGSVNKVVTFAAALERGLISPNTQLDVPGSIEMGGHKVHDAWVHGHILMTATGVLAKSSNVGTLMIAQKVGPTAFAQELAKFGLGNKTGIELPGESAGSYPAQSQWSATSFANLPIGQGIQMTLLQLTDMYQAIGNKGVLISPTIIAGTTRNGVYAPAATRPSSQVMSAKTAGTLLGMLRATVQSGDQFHKGTGSAAALTGYQVAGKTGTAQQVDPVTHAYSDSMYNATFAGVVPADHPKYAIGIMLDAPQNGSEGGTSAAPLFHDVAAYAMRAADVLPSASPAPVYDLYLHMDG